MTSTFKRNLRRKSKRRNEAVLKMKKRSAFDYLAIGIGVIVLLLFIAIYFYS
jgi:uncharacterized membrane protein YukC